MLKIENLTKNFGKITALNNISLEINSGEFFGLLGPNGAGKTTLMNHLIGFLKADSGTITYNDELVKFGDKQIKRKIGYVPQEIALYQELTAYQNLKIFGSLFKLSKKELSINIDKALELVQLLDRKNSAVKEFSGGMKRRLNLAVSILQSPEVLLCDEPTVGVDPQSRNAIFEMLQQLNKQGITIIYTTHYMEEAERLCNKLAIIDNGQIVASGSLTDLLNTLDRKKTIKIIKTAETESLYDKLCEIAAVNVFDFKYEIIQNNEFQKDSQLYTYFEKIGLSSNLIEVSSASLEDVFLHLTGRRIRD
ncbi:MAG: ABC transporter ATP-binding protein [Bacteroidetes bacterium]|nr:ABC transporter ATP-binding protein [Bacteroidota bacterium]MBU1114576.1 ABC transporter ATP-binding protein [Bacteroidota bacterium]MBU1799055.1 ABC transporter ATP-binding protein [Bacteroidota bacterium]